MDNNNIYMVIDIDRCWGCKACQVACKTAHGLSAEDGRPIEVQRIETQLEDGAVVCDYVPVLCFHCENPDCAAACPTEAIKRDKEGLMQVDEELCIGCGLCVKACPFGAMQMRAADHHKKKAVKCDLCVERRSRGFLPSCEQHCLGNVFTSCHEEEMKKLIAGRYSHRVGQTVYVSSRIKSLGQAFNS